MRRHNHQSERGYRQQNPIPCPGVSSASRFPDPSTCKENTDTRCRKRVKFVGVDENGSSRPLREVGAENSTDPKTSEYAFFKKLKSDAIHRFNSNSLHVVKENPKVFEASNCTRGANDPIIRPINFKPSMPVENEESVTYGLHLSPHATSKDPEKDLQLHSSAAFAAMCRTDKNMKPQGDNVRPEGMADEHGDIFLKKRQKLRQWVRDISFPDIDKLGSTGYDLISILLSRLLPKGMEKHNFETPDNEHVKNSFSKPLASPTPDLFNTVLHQTATGNFAKADYGPEIDNGTSIFYRDVPRERTITSLQCPNSLIHDSFFPKDLWELVPEFQENQPISYAKVESVLSPTFRKYKPLPSSQLEENDGIYSLAKSSFSVSSPPFRKYKPLRFKSLEEEENGLYSLPNLSSERNSSALLLESVPMSRSEDNLPLTCHDTKLIAYPSTLTSSLDTKNQWIGKDASQKNIAPGKLYMSSLPFDHHSENFLSPASYSSGYYKHGSGKHILQDEDLVVDLDCFPLALYRAQSSDTTAQDSDYNRTYEGGNIFNYHGFVNKIFNNGYPYPGVHFSSSGFNGSEGFWKCLSPSYSPVDHYSSSCQAIEFPGKEAICLPFLDEKNLSDVPRCGRVSHFADYNINTRNSSSFYCHLPLDESSSKKITKEICWDGYELWYV